MAAYLHPWHVSLRAELASSQEPSPGPSLNTKTKVGLALGEGCPQVLTLWLKPQPCCLSRGRQIWISTPVPSLLGCVTG